MKITIQRTESKEIEIITPAYFKIAKDEMIAIFDENNIVTAKNDDTFSCVCNRTFILDSEKLKCTDENLVDETTFFDFYNKAHAALSLLPKYSESDEIENGFTSREDDDKSVNDHYETELLNFDK